MPWEETRLEDANGYRIMNGEVFRLNPPDPDVGAAVVVMMARYALKREVPIVVARNLLHNFHTHRQKGRVAAKNFVLRGQLGPNTLEGGRAQERESEDVVGAMQTLAPAVPWSVSVGRENIEGALSRCSDDRPGIAFFRAAWGGQHQALCVGTTAGDDELKNGLFLDPIFGMVMAPLSTIQYLGKVYVEYAPNENNSFHLETEYKFLLEAVLTY